jgi:osmotically-inducible protein OsmY
MDNAPLSAAVRAELDKFGPLPDLHAKMADGIVTLSGAVPDDALRRRIEQQLLALPEVLDVHSYVNVTPPCDGLEDRFLAMLAREGVAADELHVVIANGVVTLSGHAASWFDRDAMGRLAWTLPGVREVVSRVMLPPGAVEPGRDAGGDLIP